MSSPSSMFYLIRFDDSYANPLSDNHGDVTFSSVPNELKLMIADKLLICDVSTLAGTSLEANSLLTSYLYNRALVEPARCGIPFFYCALQNCCLAAARMFVQLGADVNMRICFSRVGRWRCDCRPYGHHDWEANVAQGPPNTGHTPLEVAIRSPGPVDHEPIVRLLIDAGADIAACCRAFVSPLHMAIWDGYTDIAKLLLDRGSDWKVIDQRGRTLLHVAVFRQRAEIVQLLLAVGLDVQATDGLGWSALHLAVVNRDSDIVKALLDSRANVQATDPFGNTPLLVAVHYRGIHRSAQLLLDRARNYPEQLDRATTNAVRAGDSAVGEQIQLYPGRVEHIQLFPRGVPGVELDRYVWMRRNDRTVELLLDAGADIWAENRQRYNAIVWAVYFTKFAALRR